jgi:hypothetical protein
MSQSIVSAPQLLNCQCALHFTQRKSKLAGLEPPSFWSLTSFVAALEYGPVLEAVLTYCSVSSRGSQNVRCSKIKLVSNKASSGAV